MGIWIVFLFSCALIISCNGDQLTESLDFSTDNNTLGSQDQITTTISSGTETPTTELPYLEFEYEFLDRETFWKNNTFKCINGTLHPSPYLAKKYSQCERIHLPHNPQCTTNCQMAITMLLESKIPTLELFKSFFQIVLPDKVKEAAIHHYSKCFEKFGKTEDLLDYSCERPQPFFECMREFQSQMVCSEKVE